MKKIMSFNIFVTIFCFVMSVGLCWGMEEQGLVFPELSGIPNMQELTITTLVEHAEAVLEQNKKLEEQNESFSIHQKQLLGLLQHQEEKNKLLCAWIQKIAATVNDQNPQLEDLRSKLESLQISEEQRNTILDCIRKDVCDSSKKVMDISAQGYEKPMNVLGKKFAAQGQKLVDLARQLAKLQETVESAASTKELEIKISALQLQLVELRGKLEGSVNVLSQQQTHNSGGKMNINVGGPVANATGGTVTTAQTAVQQANQKVSIEEKAYFLSSRSNQIKTTFCAMLLFAAYCTVGPQALAGVSICMFGAVYTFKQYEAAIHHFISTFVILAGGTIATCGLMALALCLRDCEALSSMALAAALIIAGTTASQM